MPAVDFVQIAMEENPIYEGAVAVPTTGPNRIATEKLYLPGRSAVIRPNTQLKRRDDEFRSIAGTIPALVDHYDADEAYQMKGNGYALSQPAINGDGEASASLMGLVCKRAAVDTTTVPAYTTQAVPPIRRGDLYLSFLAGGGAIADFGWTIDNPL